jgi:ribosomal-protein-serine acetyltransferase
MTDEKSVEGFITKLLQAFVEGTDFFWGIWVEGRPVGAVGARDIDPVFHCAEIAYFIDKQYEGKGIVSESVGLLIRHLFDEYKIERLTLRCDVNNVRSQNVAIRFGFTKEGIEKHGFIADGKYQDMYLWSLLREEYELSKSPL